MIPANLATSTGITQVTSHLHLLVELSVIAKKCNIFRFSDLVGSFLVDTGESLPYDEFTFVLTVAIPLTSSFLRGLNGCDA